MAILTYWHFKNSPYCDKTNISLYKLVKNKDNKIDISYKLNTYDYKYNAYYTN